LKEAFSINARRHKQETKEQNVPMKIIKNLKLSGFASRGVFVSLGVAALATALVVTPLATPSSGILGAPHTMVVARASFKERVDLKFKLKGDHNEVIHAPDARETVIQRIEIAPGGTTGWHSHPGPAVAIIAAGELTLFSSEDPTCTPRTYSAGEAFVDPGQGHVHLAFNLGSENVEVWVTYFDVPPGEPVRIDAASPGNCGF
jgi:quercetin dioxygenase-like cupin family protein